MYKIIKNNQAVSRVVGYLLTLTLVTTIMTSIIYTTDHVLKDQSAEAAQILAKDIADVVANAISNCVTARRSMSSAAYESRIEIPTSLAGLKYYVELTPERVYVKTLDGRVSQSSTNFNAEELEIGLDGIVYSENGCIKIITEEVEDICKIDFGTDESDVENGYMRVTGDKEIGVPTGHPWQDNNYIYRTEIVINNVVSKELSAYDISAQNLKWFSYPLYLNSPYFNYDICNDQPVIKFYDSSDGICHHYVEYWNPGGESKVWINISDISCDEIDSIYMYYGSSSEGPDYGDPESVFEFYDDFSNGDKWYSSTNWDIIDDPTQNPYVQSSNNKCLRVLNDDAVISKYVLEPEEDTLPPGYETEDSLVSYTYYVVEATMKLVNNDYEENMDNYGTSADLAVLTDIKSSFIGIHKDSQITLDDCGQNYWTISQSEEQLKLILPGSCNIKSSDVKELSISDFDNNDEIEIMHSSISTVGGQISSKTITFKDQFNTIKSLILTSDKYVCVFRDSKYSWLKVADLSGGELIILENGGITEITSVSDGTMSIEDIYDIKINTGVNKSNGKNYYANGILINSYDTDLSNILNNSFVFSSLNSSNNKTGYRLTKFKENYAGGSGSGGAGAGSGSGKITDERILGTGYNSVSDDWFITKAGVFFGKTFNFTELQNGSGFPSNTYVLVSDGSGGIESKIISDIVDTDFVYSKKVEIDDSTGEITIDENHNYFVGVNELKQYNSPIIGKNFTEFKCLDRVKACKSTYAQLFLTKCDDDCEIEWKPSFELTGICKCGPLMNGDLNVYCMEDVGSDQDWVESYCYEETETSADDIYNLDVRKVFGSDFKTFFVSEDSDGPFVLTCFPEFSDLSDYREYDVFGGTRYNCSVYRYQAENDSTITSNGYYNIFDFDGFDYNIDTGPKTLGRIGFGCGLYDQNIENSYVLVDSIKVYQSLMYPLNVSLKYGTTESNFFGWDDTNDITDGDDIDLSDDRAYDYNKRDVGDGLFKIINLPEEGWYTVSLLVGHDSNPVDMVIQVDGGIKKIQKEIHLTNSFKTIAIPIEVNGAKEIKITFSDVWYVNSLEVSKGIKGVKVE